MSEMYSIDRRTFLSMSAIAVPVLISESARGVPASDTSPYADVCVYGGNASGVMAAVAAAREGCRVIIVEPSRWLGGMTGGGISAIDWGREEAVSGGTLGILEKKYDNAQYRAVFQEMVDRHGIQVVYEHRLHSVSQENAVIRSILLDYAPPDATGCPPPKPARERAMTVTANVFIDCSYEGDLMVASGVPYAYGRESKDQYGESLAGVRPPLWTYDIDPYVVPGDPASGLLPFIQDREIGPLGSADKLTMGYCFRYKFDLTGKGIPIHPTDTYDPAQFELWRRGFQNNIDLLRSRQMRHLGEIEEVDGKVLREGTGNMNRALLTTTVYGCNADYPDGNWETRSAIWKFHQDFLRDLVHFLQSDPAVPEALKKQALQVSFQRGMFDETGGWPHQLYVREARRMVSTYIVTQRDLEGKTDPDHSIGLASYGVDDWPYATVASDGKVLLSGGEFSILYLDERYNGIYKIPYESICPPETVCQNLLVPVCCSASHIAMTSIRMEPVWMILGESAGVAAAMAAKRGESVQDLPYEALRTRLLALGQKLERV